MEFGIKETREALQLLGSFGSTTATVTADGKVSLVELFQFVNLWPVVAPGVEGAKSIPAELSDLSEEEEEDLKDVFARSLKLNKIQIEAIWESGLSLSLELVQFINTIRDLKARPLLQA
ncbi:MAG: hypothetical protein ACRC78_04165 [Planktothrix sp.]